MNMDKNKIIELYKSGTKAIKLANMFGVSRGYIYIIVSQYKFLPPEVRKSVLLRDNSECRICGTMGQLDVHHIDKDRRNNELINLILLCKECHHNQHRKMFKHRIINGVLVNELLSKHPLVDKYGNEYSMVD